MTNENRIIDTKSHPINPLQLNSFSVIHNFRNSLKKYIQCLFQNVLKLISVILLDPQNFKVFELLGHLTYPCFMNVISKAH